MDYSDFGKRLIQARQAKGWTQMDLAEKSNISLRTIQRIEAGQANPRAYTLKQLAEITGIDFIEILDNSGDSDSEIKHSRFSWSKTIFWRLIDLFNLKTNTMKKLSILSALCIIVLIGIWGFRSEPVKSMFSSKNPIIVIQTFPDSVVYIGFKNPVFIYTENAKIADFSFDVDNGILEEKDGQYTLIARSIGEVLIYIYHKDEIVELVRIRSDMIPTPEVKVVNEKSGQLEKETIISEDQLFRIHSIHEMYKFTVSSFSISSSTDGYSREIKADTCVFSNEQIDLINSSDIGDTLSFSNIWCLGPEGIARITSEQKKLIIK